MRLQARSQARWHRLAAMTLALAACSGSQEPSGTAPSAPTPPQAAPAAATRVMPLGDSITQANVDRNSYRRPLHQKLLAAGASVDFVGSLRDNHLGPPPNPDFDLDHEGHWGWTADEILAEIDGWARAHRPDVVLIHLGSNDMLRGEGIGSTLDELEGIVAALRQANPRVAVLLAQLIPADRPELDRIVELNASLPSLAASLDRDDSPVRIVDQFSGFDAIADTADGIHPNAAGEEKLAERWLEALQPLLTTR